MIKPSSRKIWFICMNRGSGQPIRREPDGGIPFENVERVDGDRRVAGSEREERRESVKEVKHSGERFRGEDHDAESEVHALRPREERRV